MGQQTPAVGKDESLLLRLCPGVHAAPLGSPVLRPEQIGSDLGDGFLLSSLSPPSMFAILSHIRGGALPKGRPKVLKDHTPTTSSTFDTLIFPAYAASTG